MLVRAHFPMPDPYNKTPRNREDVSQLMSKKHPNTERLKRKKGVLQETVENKNRENEQ